MKTTTNKTDLVKKMRDIRDKFSMEIMDMTFEQEKEYIKNQLAELKLKKHGRQHAI
ncbi:MAG: hypothetical protein NTV01_17970 [Bacteroidia bacterium]|nr:hypothetical protein [Bacteroidia bacterium]